MADRPLQDYNGAAQYLGITPRHLRSLKAHGAVPYLTLGRLVRFDLDALDRMKASKLVEANAA